MKRARIGVIGTGWWCTRVHLPSLTTYPEAEVVGVMDRDIGRAQQAAQRFSVPHAFDDLQDLLDLGLDGVVIATPHHTHYELARAALLAGADVLVEKPMVVEPAHGRELVDIAVREARRLHVGYPYPYTAHAQRLREVVSGGGLGDLLMITSLFASPAGLLFRDGGTFAPPEDALFGPTLSTYSDPDHGGGQAHTQVTHSASLLFFVTGVVPIEIMAYTASPDMRVDLVDAAVFRTSSGAVGTLASTGTILPMQSNVEVLRVFGTGGHATLDTAAGALEIVYADGSVESPPPLDGEDRFPERRPARHLVDCVLGHAETVVDGELGLLTTCFIDGMLRSARSGAPCDLMSLTTSS